MQGLSVNYKDDDDDDDDNNNNNNNNNNQSYIQSNRVAERTKV